MQLMICSLLQTPYLQLDLPSTSLEWEKWPSLPVGMSDACSVYLNGTLYVGGGITSNDMRADAALYSFKPGVDSTWTVTDTPTYCYTLVVHNSELLLVGGYEYPTEEITNKVFTMRDGQFVEALPPMKERRSSPSAVSSGSALVVAGGYGTSGALSSVEVFKNGQWTTAPSIPRAGYDMKSDLHGDQWYLLMSMAGKVFHVSLQSLISGDDQSPWATLPSTPMNRFSATAFFGGYLLSIGGGDYPNPSRTIYAFSTFSQPWVHVANLPVRLAQSSAVVLPTGELMVIGGNDKRENCSKKVFGAFLKGMIKDSYSIQICNCFFAAPLFDIDVHFNTHKCVINLALSAKDNRLQCSLPETEDSPQSEVQLSPRDKEQGIINR